MGTPWRSEKFYRSREEVKPFIDQLVLELADSDSHWIPGGSWRRGADKIGDLDIMVVTPSGTFSEFTFPASFRPQRQKDRVAQGDYIVNGESIHMDFWVCSPPERGALLMFITGPKDLNIHQRAAALKQGFTLSQYGLFKGEFQADDGTEADIYLVLGLDWIPPRERQAYAATIPDPAAGTQEFFEPSASDPNIKYRVRNRGGSWSCNCRGYIYSKRLPRGCKHIDKVKARLGCD